MPLRPLFDMPPDPWAASALSFAEAQVGKRYCWGGTGPRCFDCSGLVQSAWRWAGIRLPRTSEAQGSALADVRHEDVRPGDILWWPGHVGLYAGAGTMIDAYNSRAGVVRRPAVMPVRVLRVLPRWEPSPRYSQPSARTGSDQAVNRSSLPR